ncbi:hypothetical protein BJV82DRAFT_673705 [Fennellomyces sp. T-0311]|nr:hypothetical protein BJV82DRAFT_673705 [Fennellomyces sp. T-0311]
MKFTFAFGVLALFLAVAAADGGASAGGNNNEGDVHGMVNNLLKSGLLTGNDKNSETTVVNGDGY